MDDRFNTIAGWTLGAGIVFLGAWLVTGEIFHSERPEKMGYPIAGVEQEGDEKGAAEQPIAHYLQTADATRGQQQFAKCQACHTINQGGANGQGPNLWGRMGAPIAGVAGYSYSPALQAKAGIESIATCNSRSLCFALSSACCRLVYSRAFSSEIAACAASS